MKKVAVVVGHTEFRQGAVSPFKDRLPSEWRFNSEIAEGLRSPEVDIYYYDPKIIGYKARVDKLAEEINKKDYEAVIELHYNASGIPQANGVEALYYLDNEVGKKLAAQYCKEFSELYGIKDRGGKALYNKKQRGFYFHQKMKTTTLILEPFFGTNEEDVFMFTESPFSYKGFLREFISNNILK